MNTLRYFRWYMVILMALCSLHCAHTSWPWSRAKSPDRGVRIIRQVRGSHLSLSEPRIKLINDYNQLSALGIDQLKELRADFYKHSVLLVVVGQRPTGGYWVHVSGVQTRGKDLYFQGTANKPSETQMVTQTLTYPYTAVLISKVHTSRLHPEIESVTGAELP